MTSTPKAEFLPHPWTIGCYAPVGICTLLFLWCSWNNKQMLAEQIWQNVPRIFSYNFIARKIYRSSFRKMVKRPNTSRCGEVRECSSSLPEAVKNINCITTLENLPNFQKQLICCVRATFLRMKSKFFRILEEERKISH